MPARRLSSEERGAAFAESVKFNIGADLAAGDGDPGQCGRNADPQHLLRRSQSRRERDPDGVHQG